MNKMTFGVIVTNRSFFPKHLVGEGRKQILDKLSKMGFNTVIVSENETPLGAVQTLADAKICAELFKKHKDTIDGIIVILPNFGDEVGVSTALDLARLNVPILVQACSDDVNNLQLSNRRDAFCGKLSLCNNLYQRNIKFTNTALHTCDIASEQFSADINNFAAVCRVVKGITSARLGAIGTRPDPFHTVRFSEKLLQASGITISVVDLSDIIFRAMKMDEKSAEVKQKITEIRAYGKIPAGISEEKVLKQAKLCLVIEQWIKENDCHASAIQCWDSIQNNYGCATCLSMSMMGERGLPSACEMDITGALTMYALNLASGQPSGYLDWNNNFAADNNKCINLHCSNFPKSFFDTEFEISNLDVLGTTIDPEKCFGACKAQIKGGPMTYAKITTDDKNGKIKLYVGEGMFLNEKVDTKGGVAVCQVPDLQRLLNYITQNGFEHHVAMNRSHCAPVLEEALGKYLGWEVYRHQ
jgi:L-fucose isomerase-like protein